VKAASKAIKKSKTDKKGVEDSEELKKFLMLGETPAIPRIDKKKLGAKKRKYLRLMTSNPTRDENPEFLEDLQVKSAKQMLAS